MQYNYITCLYKQGKGAIINVYTPIKNKTSPVISYVNKLKETEKTKIIALITRFANEGEIRNKEKFKIEEHPIYCFKSDDIRVLCFFLPNPQMKSIVLTNCYKKKSNKMPPSEFKRALSIYKQIIG